MPYCVCHRAYSLKGTNFPIGCRVRYIPLAKGHFILTVNGKVIGNLPPSTFFSFFHIERKCRK